MLRSTNQSLGESGMLKDIMIGDEVAPFR